MQIRLRWSAGVSLVQIRLMQRPRTRRAVCFTAAAELERQESHKRRKTKEKGENEKRQSTLFIRKG